VFVGNERHVQIIFFKNNICITVKPGAALWMGLELYTEIYMRACERFQKDYLPNEEF
jgi:hypothetical protein